MIIFVDNLLDRIVALQWCNTYFTNIKILLDSTVGRIFKIDQCLGSFLKLKSLFWLDTKK